MVLVLLPQGVQQAVLQAAQEQILEPEQAVPVLPSRGVQQGVQEQQLA